MHQIEGRKMVNFDVYKNNPKAAATLIAREGMCRACPIYAKCDSELVHDYDRCYKTWSRFFESNGRHLDEWVAFPNCSQS